MHSSGIGQKSAIIAGYSVVECPFELEPQPLIGYVMNKQPVEKLS
jgi:hypothetical protein